MDKKKLLLIIGVIVFAIAIMIAGYFLFVKKSNNKNDNKTMTCVLADGSSSTIIEYDKDNNVKKVEIQNIHEFENKILAENFYNLYIDVKENKYEIKGNKVIETISQTNEETDDFTADRYREYLISRGYSCN